MIERYAIHDEQGRVTAYVTRETSHHPAAFSRAPRSRRAESPTVEAVCRIVGLVMLATFGLLVWLLLAAS